MKDETSDCVEPAGALNDLLFRTSRTFALAIPCLPAPAQREITVAYLLFRVADTIEDGPLLDRAQKLDALHRLLMSLDQVCMTNADGNHRQLTRPTNNPDYLDLLQSWPLLMAASRGLRPPVRDQITGSVGASIRGMSRFIAAGTPGGHVRLESLDQLREYCYCVAGIVGEMLTEVFLLGADWLAPARGQLLEHARWFGEGLQLVNILKDAAQDEREGRCFVPADVSRADLFALARADLSRAEEYVRLLQEADAPPGYVAFTQLPLRLAWPTLECIESAGAGSKLSRQEVLQILFEVAPPSTSFRQFAAADREARA